MRLYIPSIGDRIILTEDWTFQLHDEGRNETLFVYLDEEKPDRIPTENYWGGISQEPGFTEVELLAGSILKIDRIYIRKGLDEFSSVTFMLEGAKAPMPRDKWDRKAKKYVPGVQNRAVRFWAKLDDVNNIEFDFAPPKR